MAKSNERRAMRELRFRAWNKLDKEFAQNVDCLLDMRTSKRVFALDDGNRQLIIEQYTGLKDQYGKDIYEGDIIKVAESVKGYVTQDVEGRWIIFGDDRKPIEGCIALGELEDIPELNLRTILATEYCSIIGNIHENPELLEGKL